MSPSSRCGLTAATVLVVTYHSVHKNVHTVSIEQRLAFAWACTLVAQQAQTSVLPFSHSKQEMLEPVEVPVRKPTQTNFERHTR